MVVCTLTEKVLPKELFEDLDDQDDMSDRDVILTNYINFLNTRSEYYRGIRLVQDPKQGDKTWESDGEVRSANTVLGRLDLSTHRKGVVKTPNAPNIPVTSLRERRCLFPDDLVPVDAMTNEIICGEEQEQKFNETHFGKAILCRVNPRSMIEFMPLDKRYPKLINLPSLTKHDRNGVTCFDPSSMNDRLKVNNFIPKDQAVSMVFVVKVLRWRQKFPHPLGLTVGAIPCGSSVHSGDLLLKVAHHIPMTSHSPCNITSSSCSTARRRVFEDVITIDPTGSTDHDDALSCEHHSTGKDGSHRYTFGVHITDVQRLIPKDSNVDITARERACSVYSSPDTCVSNMLPEEVVQAANILPMQTRDAFSVVADVTVRDKRVVGHIQANIVKSKITSSKELTYEDAQKLIFSSKGSRPLKTLWIVASHLRQQRLGQNAAVHLKVHREDELSCPEAHMLVEELMIWANQQIAEELVNSPPMILRCQPAPDGDELEGLVTTHSQHFTVSLDLQQHVPARQRDCPPVQVLPETIHKMKAALKEGAVRKALHLVQFEHLHPQVAVGHALYRQVCEPSSYRVPSEDKDCSHHGLHCDLYTRFTSPIRRYLDLVVQRILNSCLQGEENPYADEVEDVENMCWEVREREREVDKYETGRRRLVLACQLQQSSQEYMWFVKKVEEGKLFNVFCDPSLKLGLDASAVHLKHLNAKKIPQKESSPEPEGDDSPRPQHCIWQVKMASDNSKLKPDKFLSNPHLRYIESGPSEADVQIVFFTAEETDSIECSDLQETRINASLKPFTQTIPGENWRRLQELAISPPSDLKRIRELLPSPPVQRDPQFPPIGHTPLWVYEFHRPLQSCEVLRVQLTGCINSATQRVSPTVQLLEVGPNLRVCIQHNSSPTGCFTDTALSKPPKQGHTSINEYFLFWEQAMLAEAATASLTDTELMIITDVTLVWPPLRRVTDSQGQVFYQLPRLPAKPKEPKDYCAWIHLSKHFAASSYDFFTIHEGDLMCVRCYGNHGGAEVRGVFHMVVHSVEKPEESEEVVGVDVYLKFVGERPNYISQLIKSSLKKLSYEVQLIPLSLPFR